MRSLSASCLNDYSATSTDGQCIGFGSNRRLHGLSDAHVAQRVILCTGATRHRHVRCAIDGVGQDVTLLESDRTKGSP